MRALALTLLFACGTARRDLGVEEHQRAADVEERSAAAEQRLYDPSRRVHLNECPFAGSLHESPCWSVDQNPTAIHLQEAQRHMLLAAKHREASRALREAEARACGGLSDHDRDTSPFAHRDDVVRSEPLREETERGPRDLGAALVFRAVPGLTVERLQRLVDCHLARNAALGFDQDEPDDPLDLPGVGARVREGLRVEVTASIQKTAREIQARAARLR